MLCSVFDMVAIRSVFVRLLDFFEFYFIFSPVFGGSFQPFLNVYFIILEHLFSICQDFLWTEYKEI